MRSFHIGTRGQGCTAHAAESRAASGQRTRDLVSAGSNGGDSGNGAKDGAAPRNVGDAAGKSRSVPIFRHTWDVCAGSLRCPRRGGGYAACGLERRTGYPSHRRVALETSPPGNRRSALRCPLVVPKSLCNNLLHDGRNGTVCAQTDRAVPRPSCESPIRLRYQLLVRCDRGAMELVRE